MTFSCGETFTGHVSSFPLVGRINVVRDRSCEEGPKIPSPSTGEGQGGGARRRCLDTDRLPPSRPSPARGEGAQAPWASRVPNSIRGEQRWRGHTTWRIALRARGEPAVLGRQTPRHHSCDGRGKGTAAGELSLPIPVERGQGRRLRECVNPTSCAAYVPVTRWICADSTARAAQARSRAGHRGRPP